MERLLVLLAVVVVTAAVGRWWTTRDGRVRGLRRSPQLARGRSDRPSWSQRTRDALDVVAAINPTTALTFVEFTAPACVPCATTAAMLRDVARTHGGVSVVTMDVAADGLDLARAHRVLRAPTTLLVSDAGHLLGRISGVPDPDDLTRLVEHAGRFAPTGR